MPQPRNFQFLVSIGTWDLHQLNEFWYFGFSVSWENSLLGLPTRSLLYYDAVIVGITQKKTAVATVFLDDIAADVENLRAVVTAELFKLV